MIDAGISLEQLVQLRHALRLPAREGHVVLLGEAHDIIRHGLVIILDHILLIEERSRAVADRVEEIGAGPVKDRHEVVADHLDAKLGQVADALLVVLDVLVAGRQTDLDVVMHVDGLDNIHVEAVRLQLLLHFSDFFDGPDFAGHLVVKRPHDAGDAGNLLDIGKADLVIAFAVPTETHLHRHKNSSYHMNLILLEAKRIIVVEAIIP